jgi:hypothetical protein
MTLRASTVAAVAAAVAAIAPALPAAAGSRAGTLTETSLLTETQAEAVSKRAVIVRIATDAGARVKVRVKGSMKAGRAGGRVRLGPVQKSVGPGQARFKLKLYDAGEEFLSTAIESCIRTPLTLRATSNRGGPGEPLRLQTELRRPASCETKVPTP